MGYFNSFDHAWPWIGAVAGATLLILLFCTDKLRGPLRTTSRWRDPVWLSWFASFLYFAHNTEEYGIDLFGQLHEFPNAIASILHTAGTPGGLPPPAFFMAVNIPLVWFAGPILALLSPRHTIAGLSFYGIIFVNAISHIVPFFIGIGYQPGALTAITLFVPSSVWVAYACFGKGKLSYKALASIIVIGLIVHVLLLGPTILFIRGYISSGLLVAIQIANGFLFILNARLIDAWQGKRQS